MPRRKPRPITARALQKGCSKPKGGSPVDELPAAHAGGRAASAPKPAKGARAPRRPSLVGAPPPARLVGYARVSTDDQTNALQADAMARANVDVVQGRRSALVGSRLVQARRMPTEGKSQVEVAHRRDSRSFEWPRSRHDPTRGRGAVKGKTTGPSQSVEPVLTSLTAADVLEECDRLALRLNPEVVVDLKSALNDVVIALISTIRHIDVATAHEVLKLIPPRHDHAGIGARLVESSATGREARGIVARSLARDVLMMYVADPRGR